MTDIEIALAAKKKDIEEIAEKININSESLELYGKYKAKLNMSIDELDDRQSNLILVTSINPTRAGEGKSTVAVGLVDALNNINKKAIGVLREPSMGPVFGLKGGATGGGYSQVIPMEDINLHFTGDIHAITSANNLISTCIDNHIHHGNELNIDINNIFFKRVIDMNDRTLRNVEIGKGSDVNGVERKESFTITAASEVMAILCLANDMEDLKIKIGEIIFAKDLSGNILKVKDLNIVGAVCVILKDALKPNLVQTIKHSPILLHGGPFANIAHGCNSLIATKTALKLSDYVVTEAGFGADLGSEKFINIKCRKAGLKPKVAVIVVTLRALKLHGGADLDKLSDANADALVKGIENLKRHIEIVKSYDLNFVIAINQFQTDLKEELNILIQYANAHDYPIELADVFTDNSNGATKLAQTVADICEKSNGEIKYTYNLEDSIVDKITKIAVNLYGAKEIKLTAEAQNDLEFIKRNKLESLAVCIAKTPASFSSEAKLIGAPKDFTLEVKRLSVSNGAGFIVVMIGNVLLMPGLPKVPQAEYMSITKEGKVNGLN